jgi:hypothetical protein
LGNRNGATLGEIGVLDGAFEYGSVLFRRLIDDGGEVATATVFHENEDISSISIEVVSCNVVMMNALENVPGRCCCQSVVKLQELVKTHIFCYNLLSISLAHPLQVEFLAREYLREGP